MKFLIPIIILFSSCTKAQPPLQINGTGATVKVNGVVPSKIKINISRSIYTRDLIIISGQSNAMSWHFANADNSVLVPFGFTGLKTNIKVLGVGVDTFYYNLNLPTVADANPYATNWIDNWGMEQHTIHGIAAKHGREAYLMRWARGASSIVRWLPGYDLRTEWLEMFGSSIRTIARAGFIPNITVIWVQGESDNSVDEYTQYETRLRYLISDAKTLVTPYSTNLKWINCKLASTFFNNAHGDAINGAMDAIAADTPNVYVFDPEPHVVPFGDFHYNKDALMDFSEALWAFIQANGIL